MAYVDTGRAWVAAGAPIAPEPELLVAAREFATAAARAGRRAVFFATEQRAAELAGFSSLLIGEQPIWDPRGFEALVLATPSLREQLRRARAKGVVVSRVDPADVTSTDAPLRRSVD